MRIMLGTYVNVELANPLTKRTLLVIWQIQDVFNTSRTRVQAQVLKQCKYVQESSEQVLCFKTRQKYLLGFKM